MGGRRQLKARVEGVGPDGAGRATDDDGRDIRVPGVLPGEVVTVDVHHVRRDGTCFARLTRVLEAAADRRDPPCPHHLRCGGCDFLHAGQAWQLDWKRRRVAAALGRPPSAVPPTVASPHAFGYRHLVKLVRGPGSRLGSYAPRSHDVVDMAGCRVHAPGAEAIADAVRALLADRPQVIFRYLLIRWSSSEARAVVTVVVRSDERPTVGPLVQSLARRPEVAQVRLHLNDDPGDGLLTAGGDELAYDDGRPVFERTGPVQQQLTGGAFSQINPGAAARLYARVVEQLEPAEDRILDLYSGSGGIAMTLLAAEATEVYAVEASPAAVGAARAAAAEAGWSARLHAWVDTVEGALPRVPRTDKVVVNPPRKGLSPEVRAALAARPWRRLVYVSCDPDTLARDVAALPGEVESVIPLDLFPQTRHVETVLTLNRSD